MARIEMDRAGVTSVRSEVRGDPTVLRAVADAVAAASAAARVAVGAEAAALGSELERFRLVHARIVDAMADAFAAMSGAVDGAVRSDRETELAAVSALGTLGGVARPVPPGPTA